MGDQFLKWDFKIQTLHSECCRPSVIKGHWDVFFKLPCWQLYHELWPFNVAATGLVLKPCSLHSCQKGKAKASWRIMGSEEAFLEPFWVRFINHLNSPWWSSPNPAEIFHLEIKFCCSLEVREQVFRNHSLVVTILAIFINWWFCSNIKLHIEHMSYIISLAQNNDNHKMLSISKEEGGSLAYMMTIHEMGGMHNPDWTHTSLHLEVLL